MQRTRAICRGVSKTQPQISSESPEVREGNSLSGQLPLNVLESSVCQPIAQCRRIRLGVPSWAVEIELSGLQETKKFRLSKVWGEPIWPLREGTSAKIDLVV